MHILSYLLLRYGLPYSSNNAVSQRSFTIHEAQYGLVFFIRGRHEVLFRSLFYGLSVSRGRLPTLRLEEYESDGSPYGEVSQSCILHNSCLGITWIVVE